VLKERTQTINNKIKLHILEVHMNKLGYEVYPFYVFILLFTFMHCGAG